MTLRRLPRPVVVVLIALLVMTVAGVLVWQRGSRPTDQVAASHGPTGHSMSSVLSVEPSPTLPGLEGSETEPGAVSEAALSVGPAPTPRITTGPLTNPALPGRQVWAHMVPHGLPDYSNWAPNSSYGTGYPLDLIKGDWTAALRPTSGVPRAQRAGVTGMSILQFDWENKGSDFVVDWMKQADPTWRDTNPSNNFSVSPCLYVKQISSVVRMVREYAGVVAGHPSAARVAGKLVVWVYAPRELPATAWRQARSDLRAAGLNVFLLGDLNINSSQVGYRFDPALVRDYLPSFDAVWLFDDSTSKFWPDLQRYLVSVGKPFAGGTMPGYNRETSPLGGYVSARGTKMMRQQWGLQLASGASWATLVTWNDAVERSEIKANADWNSTRQEVNAFFSAKQRGLAYPKPSAQLSVTSPDFVRVGEVVQVEGLVLNGSAAAVQVQVKLVDANGVQVGSTVSAWVGSGQAGDATTNVRLSAQPAGQFVRAVAWTTDAAGRVVQRVSSAPVVVFERGVVATSMMRQHFYSIPAAHALPQNVGLRLTASPVVDPGRAQAVVSVPSTVDVRFVEVIQNTRQVDLGFDINEFSVKVPMGVKPIVGMDTTATPNGFYLARVIDEQERVGYSNPIWVP